MTHFTLSEFIFGDLSTAQGRLRQARMARVGVFHDSTLTPLDPQAHEPIQITVRVGADIAVKTMTLYYTTDRSLPQPGVDGDHPARVALPMQRIQLEWDTLQWCYLEQWAAVIPGQGADVLVRYAIAATTTTDAVIGCPYVDLTALKQLSGTDNFNGDFNFEALEKKFRDNQPQVYEFYVDQQPIPDWLRDAVIYQIFVDRFAPTPGKDFKSPGDRSGIYGGTLNGMISKLDYLVELGVSCLWLTPIFPSPSHHGYDPTDYGTVEPRIGTMEDWQRLVREAHQRGIRLVLDYVVNHFSNEHPAFQAALNDRQHSTYDWFRFRNYPDQYDCFFDVPHQPELNADHPDVRDYFISHGCQWLEQGGDGFRLDYAHGVSHAFWSRFRQATRQARADSVTFGEITQPPSVVRSYAGRMDGCLDFKLLELLRGFFVFESLTVRQFDQALTQHYAYFGSSLVLPSFLDNHDMNRFLWAVDGDKRRLKLAALCQFTLPHPPIIYYGTEVGLSQLESVGRLEESRLPMVWGEDQDHSLLTFYQQLIALRRQQPDQWRQQRQSWLIDDAHRVYGYGCGDYAIALNNQDQAITLSLPAPWQQGPLVLTTESTTVWQAKTAELSLAPFTGAICRRLI